MKKIKKIKNHIFHFIGIGGIGMSGIAELMMKLGYRIQGSDLSLNNNIAKLKKNKKINIFIGHKKSNINKSNIVVYSSAIKKNNPEIIEAKNKSIPLLSRAEMLAQLMLNKRCIAIGGSHGKTTTTSLVGAVLQENKLDPTIINGGVINSFSSNYRLGFGKWMVVEADESDGSFIKLPHEINIITNIDYEHMDYYKNFDSLMDAFKNFSTNIPFYGSSIICLEDKNSFKLSQKIKTRKLITYGFKKKYADLNIKKITTDKFFSNFIIEIKKNKFPNYKKDYVFKLNLLGKHNVLNATSAIAVALSINLPINLIKKSLRNYKGVKRRFSYLGKIKKSFIYDDYAHHPSEIKATLNIAKLISKKKVIVFFQPHRFSRTKYLYSEFLKVLKNVDILYVCDIYSAGEKPIAKIHSSQIVKDLKKMGSKNAYYKKDLKNLKEFIIPYSNEENLIIFMGAGSISQWANNLMENKIA